MILLSSTCMASVPQPYTPVKASPRGFRCLGRFTRLGPMLLPTQITAAGNHLLTAPVRLVTEPAALFGDLTGKVKVLGNDGNQARWEWAGQSSALAIRARMSGDCDGFCWYEITLTPKQPVKMASLRLEIPRRAETASYLHTANFTWGQQVSRGLSELGGKWQGHFMPYVWLGNEDRGLAWCCESDQGWLLEQSTNALQVRTEGNLVLFAAAFLDHQETINTPLTLSFGLQATPAKPVSFAWRAKARMYHGVQYSSANPDKNGKVLLDALREGGVRTVIYHDAWGEYYGQVSPSDPQGLRKLISECHRRGMKLLVYVGYGLARTAPELQGHHDEWSAMPLIPWTTTYKPEYRNFDATCAHSGWADWLVKGIDQLFTGYELDGLYFDGTTEAFRCQNEAHGCGWRDANGKLHPHYPLLAVRKMMRRIADVVHRYRPGAILDAHMSASLTMPTLSFCDSYWDGEQYENYTAADKVEIPLHVFRAEFMGWAHGLDAEFLCYTNRPFTFPEAIAMAWVHGVEVRPLSLEHLGAVSLIWQAFDRFGTSQAKWLPYWKGSGVTAEVASVKTSAFVRNGRALIFISHLKREPLKTTLRLDRNKLGLKPGTLTATDALTGQPLKLDGLGLPSEFEGMGYRVIEVTTR